MSSRRRATPTRRAASSRPPRFLLVLTDLRLPAGSGFDVLAAAKESDPDMPVIVMTAFGTVEEAVRAMKEGAADFLTKPVDTDHLLLLLDRAIERRRLRTEYLLLKEEHQRRFGLPRVLGDDPELKETMLAIQRAAQSDATVLILGESGTGKELMARSLHQLSARAKAPFVAINCAAIPEALLENELFGHEKGAFTGRQRAQGGQGRDGPPRHAVPRRDRRPAPVAPGQDPAPGAGAAVRARRRRRRRSASTCGSWRPPTATCRRPWRARSSATTCTSGSRSSRSRSRRCAAGAATSCRWPRPSSSATRRSSAARGCRSPRPRKRALLDHAWPGNVRELQNSLERAVILATGRRSGRSTCASSRLRRRGPSLADVLDLSGPLAEVGKRAAARAEEEAIQLALRKTGGDRAAAAERLGVSASTLAPAAEGRERYSSARRLGRRFAASTRLRRRIAGGRHLDQLVVVDELERLLQVQHAVRRQADRVVGGRGAHVGQLLRLGDVHVHVRGPGVLAHDHALVDRTPGPMNSSPRSSMWESA